MSQALSQVPAIRRSRFALGLRSHGRFDLFRCGEEEGWIVRREVGLGYYKPLDDEKRELLGTFVLLARPRPVDATSHIDCIHFAEEFGTLDNNHEGEAADWRKESVAVEALLWAGKVANARERATKSLETTLTEAIEKRFPGLNGVLPKPKGDTTASRLERWRRSMAEHVHGELTQRLSELQDERSLRIRCFATEELGVRVEPDLLVSRPRDAVWVQLLMEIAYDPRPLSTCGTCGRSYLPKKTWQLYCSPACKALAWYRDNN